MRFVLYDIFITWNSLWLLPYKSSVRAALNGILETLINFGFIISFVLGRYIYMSDQAKIYLIVPTIGAVLLFLLPESPVFLAKIGKYDVSIPFLTLNGLYSCKNQKKKKSMQEANKANSFYRGGRHENNSVQKTNNIELETQPNAETANKATATNSKWTRRDFSKCYAFIKGWHDFFFSNFSSKISQYINFDKKTDENKIRFSPKKCRITPSNFTFQPRPKRKRRISSVSSHIRWVFFAV